MYEVKSHLCPPCIQDLFKRPSANCKLRDNGFITPRFSTMGYRKRSMRYLGSFICYKLNKELRNINKIVTF